MRRGTAFAIVFEPPRIKFRIGFLPSETAMKNATREGAAGRGSIDEKGAGRLEGIEGSGALSGLNRGHEPWIESWSASRLGKSSREAKSGCDSEAKE